jgi:hypothetical protein
MSEAVKELGKYQPPDLESIRQQSDRFNQLHDQLADLRPEDLSRDQIKSLKGQPAAAPLGKKPLGDPGRHAATLYQTVVDLGQDIKSLLVKSEDRSVISHLECIRAVAYDFLGHIADEIVEHIETVGYEAATPLIKEFAVLYWGEMGFLRGERVGRAMKDFRERLIAIDDEVGARLPDSVKGLPPAAKKGGQIPDNWQRSVTSRDKDQFREEIKKVRVKPDLVAALKRSRDQLQRALKAELSETIAPERAPAAAY